MPDSVDRTARDLIAQYGEDASVIAVMRAAEHAASFDRDALAHWDAIIARIAALQNESGAPGGTPDA